MTKNRRMVLTIICILLVFLSISLILGARYRNSQSTKRNKIEEANVALINTVNQQLNLPYSKPIIVTVYDPADFNGSTVLNQLKKEDKILLYLNSNEAVIFRPKDNKVVDIVSARAVLNTKD